jgi:hypothetical protein
MSGCMTFYSILDLPKDATHICVIVAHLWLFHVQGNFCLICVKCIKIFVEPIINCISSLVSCGVGEMDHF